MKAFSPTRKLQTRSWTIFGSHQLCLSCLRPTRKEGSEQMTKRTRVKKGLESGHKGDEWLKLVRLID